jgi:hypothetical protein
MKVFLGVVRIPPKVYPSFPIMDQSRLLLKFTGRSLERGLSFLDFTFREIPMIRSGSMTQEDPTTISDDYAG